MLTRGIPPNFRGGVHIFIPPSDIGPVPSLSSHAIAYRWCSYRQYAGTEPVVLRVVQVKGGPLFPHPLVDSLWSGQGLLRERWCCARGWWMLAVLTRLIAGDTWNLVSLSSFSTPHHAHTLATYTHHMDTNIQLNHGLRKNQPGDNQTHPLIYKLPNLHRMLLFGE